MCGKCRNHLSVRKRHLDGSDLYRIRNDGRNLLLPVLLCLVDQPFKERCRQTRGESTLYSPWRPGVSLARLRLQRYADFSKRPNLLQTFFQKTWKNMENGRKNEERRRGKRKTGGFSHKKEGLRRGASRGRGHGRKATQNGSRAYIIYNCK